MLKTKILKLYFCLVIFPAIFLCLNGDIARADGNQKIELKIDENLNALLDWTMPLETAANTELNLPSIDNIGYTASIKFELIGAKDDIGVITPRTYSGVTTFASHYTTASGEKNIKISYKIKTPFNKSLLIFELPWYSGERFNNPQIKIIYPDSLELVSTSHKIIKTNPLELEFDSYKMSDIRPVIVSFVEKKLPAGEIEKRAAPYVIRGQPKYVDKLYDAAKDLTFVDDMFAKVYGINLPDKIYIIASELNTSAMNYEAGALAVPPNIMVFNAKTMTNMRKLDLQKTIVHETTHLAMLGKRELFGGAIYYAPWFDEGLAVFSEYYAADNYLVKNEADLKIEDVLSGYRKFSVAELKNEYDYDFDYYFLNDDPRRQIIDSYSHAGLVFYNFFDKAGSSAIKDLLSSLAGATPDYSFGDSDQILNRMKRISGSTPTDTLFPFKNDPKFETKIKKFVRNTYTSTEEGKIAYQTFKNETKAYFGGEVNLEPVKIEEVVPSEEPKKPVVEKSKASEIKKEEKSDTSAKNAPPKEVVPATKTSPNQATSSKERVVRKFDASKEIDSNNGGQKPENKNPEGFIQKIINFFRSLF